MHTRIRGLAAILLAFALTLTVAGTALAHGTNSGPIQTFTQALGPYEIGVTLELPQAAPGTVFIDIVAPPDMGDAALTLRAAPRGQDTASAPSAEIRTQAGADVIYYSQLDIDRLGDWNLSLDLVGPNGSGRAQIPFTVTAATLPPYSIPLFVALGALIILMIASIAISAVFGQRRQTVPAWLSWLLGRALFAAVIVAVIFGVQQLNFTLQEARASASTVAPVLGRPHANLSLATEPAEPQAGQPATLTLDLSDGGTGLPIDDIVPHHEALMHLVVINEDGSAFEHLHPAQSAPGRYAITITPSQPGRYTAYAEIERVDSGTQVVRADFTVAGSATEPATPAPGIGTRTIDGLNVAITSSQTPIKAQRQTTFTFSFSDASGPVLTMQPWLGMAGHLIVRSDDTSIYGHVHAAEQMAPVGPPIVSNNFAYGPDVRFVYTFPKPGRYLVWAQFRYEGRIITVPMTLEVES